VNLIAKLRALVRAERTKGGNDVSETTEPQEPDTEPDTGDDDGDETETETTAE
jgi:hypothetical protein